MAIDKKPTIDCLGKPFVLASDQRERGLTDTQVERAIRAAHKSRRAGFASPIAGCDLDWIDTTTGRECYVTLPDGATVPVCDA